MHPNNDHAQLKVNPFLIYIGIGLSSIVLQRFLPLPFIEQSSARILGLVIMIVSFGAGLPAIRRMFAAQTSPNPSSPTKSLVLSGPYRFSRNPMYIGLSLLYAGLMTFLQIGWGLLLLPVVIWLITVWVIVPEEEYLEHKFGAEYSGYKSRVKRWI